MRLLFEMDLKDYDDCTHTFVRNSARSIIIRDGKIAMIHSKEYDYYKFPGGGIEGGENPVEAMIRETREEAGLVVLPESVREYGYVHRIQRSDGDKSECFVQDNFYYLCDTDGKPVSQQLDEYEKKESYELEYVDPATVIAKNRSVGKSPYNPMMFEREARVVELLIAEGILSNRNFVKEGGTGTTMDWENMQRKLEALYVLDNALTDPKKDYLRLVRKTVTDTETRYAVDNGAGDTLDVVFAQNAIVIKGFDHENSLSQFAADEWNQKIIDQMYEGMDSSLIELFSEEDRDYSTFVIWYDGTPHQNPTEGNDGGQWLLSHVRCTYEEFKKYVEGYYSRDFCDELLKKLFENGTLSEKELDELIE